MGKEIYDLINVAYDLCYPKEVIERLRKAKSEEEATRIMITARKQMYEEKRKC